MPFGYALQNGLLKDPFGVCFQYFRLANFTGTVNRNLTVTLPLRLRRRAMRGYLGCCRLTICGPRSTSASPNSLELEFPFEMFCAVFEELPPLVFAAATESEGDGFVVVVALFSASRSGLRMERCFGFTRGR